jgi:PhnB protein
LSSRIPRFGEEYLANRTPSAKGARTMQLVPYLSFDGNCREAFEFYQQVLGGEITDMISHRDMGIDIGDPAWHDKIMHANLLVNGEQLMGGDRPPGSDGSPQGFSVSMHLEADSEAERIYAALAEGGSVLMPLDKTEWSSRFGMLTDKYGTPWIINSTEGTAAN